MLFEWNFHMFDEFCVGKRVLKLKIPDGPGPGQVDLIWIHICVPTLRKYWAQLDMNLGPLWVFSDSLHPKESKKNWTLTRSIHIYIVNMCFRLQMD